MNSYSNFKEVERVDLGKKLQQKYMNDETFDNKENRQFGPNINNCQFNQYIITSNDISTNESIIAAK